MEKRTRTGLVLGAAILGAAGIICKIIGVLFRIWAYRILGEEGMVYYEIVFPFYSWLLILSSSGIPIAISRMVAERAARLDYSGARRVFLRSYRALAIIGLISTAVMYFGAEWISVSILGKSVELALAFKALSPALFFVSLLCAYRGYLQGMQLMTGTGVSQIAEQLFKCGFGLYLAWRLSEGGPAWGAAGALLGVAISECLALGVMMLFMRKNKERLLPRGLGAVSGGDRDIVKKLIRIAIPITLGASVLPLTSMLDVRMIYRILGTYLPTDYIDSCYVALSTNVRSLINLPASLTVALAISIVPSISGFRARRDGKGVQLVAGLGLKLAMIVGLPCAAGLFVLGGPIIQMLFRSIEPEALALATRIMRYASISVIFISLVQTMTGALQGVGKQRLPVYFLCIGGAVKIISNYVFLSMPELNIVGASLSNIACYAVAGILDAIFLCKTIKLRPSLWAVLGKPLVASVLMGLVTYYCYQLLYKLHPGTMVTLISVFVGMAVYLVLAIGLGFFDERELAFIPGGTKLKRFIRRKG